MKKLMGAFAMMISVLAQAEFLIEEDGKISGYARLEAEIDFNTMIKQNEFMGFQKIGLTTEVLSLVEKNLLAGFKFQANPQYRIDKSSSLFSHFMENFEVSIKGGVALYNDHGLLVGFLLESGIYDGQAGLGVEMDHLIGSQLVFVSKDQVTVVSGEAHTQLGEEYFKNIGFDLKARSSISLPNNEGRTGLLDYLVIEAGIYDLGSAKRDVSADLKMTLELYISNGVKRKKQETNVHLFLTPGASYNFNSKQTTPTFEIGIRAKL